MTSATRLLVIDDEPAIRRLLRRGNHCRASHFPKRWKRFGDLVIGAINPGGLNIQLFMRTVQPLGSAD